MAEICLIGATERERNVIDKGEAILFGFSPFNPFYNPRSMTRLLEWGAEHFDNVHVLLAGQEAAFRFIAAGHPPRDSVRRTIRIVNDIRCVARRTLASVGYENPDQNLHVWTRFAGNNRYRQVRAAAEHAYATVPEMRTVIRSMAESALAGNVSGTPTEGQIDANVCYVFAEAPLAVDAPGVLGYSSTVMAYHRPVPLYELALTGIAPELTPSPGHAVGLLTTREKEEALS